MAFENYADALAITPSDTADNSFAAILVGVGGTVKVVTELGSTTTITAIAGQMIPVRVTRVFATGTSATSLTGLR